MFHPTLRLGCLACRLPGHIARLAAELATQLLASTAARACCRSRMLLLAAAVAPVFFAGCSSTGDPAACSPACAEKTASAGLFGFGVVLPAATPTPPGVYCRSSRGLAHTYLVLSSDGTFAAFQDADVLPLHRVSCGLWVCCPSCGTVRTSVLHAYDGCAQLGIGTLLPVRIAVRDEAVLLAGSVDIAGTFLLPASTLPRLEKRFQEMSAWPDYTTWVELYLESEGFVLLPNQREEEWLDIAPATDALHGPESAPGSGQ